MKTFLRSALVLLTVVGLQGCIQEDFKYIPSDTDHGILDVSAWGFIQEHPELKTMKDAVTRTGLGDLFDREGDRTFILPNDKAFKDFMPFNGYKDISEIPVPVLRNLLKYLVVEDRVIFTDPALFKSNNPIPYETANGQTMYLSHRTSFIGTVNEGTGKSFEIYTSNIQPLNGVAHVVSAMVYFSLPSANMEIDTSRTGTPLRLDKNIEMKVSVGSSVAVDPSTLEVSGASPENIIFSMKNGPAHGWLILNGIRFLKAGDRFTQNDIGRKNIIYVNDGSGSRDQIGMSAISTSGYEIDDFDLKIRIE